MFPQKFPNLSAIEILMQIYKVDPNPKSWSKVQRPHSGFNAKWARHSDSLGIQFVGCLYNLRARGNCFRDPAPRWFNFCNAADVRSQKEFTPEKGQTPNIA